MMILTVSSLFGFCYYSSILLVHTKIATNGESKVKEGADGNSETGGCFIDFDLFMGFVENMKP